MPSFNAYGVGFFAPGHDHGDAGLGNAWLYYNANTGKLAGGSIPGKGSAGDIFMQAQFPTGTFETLRDVLTGSGDQRMARLKLAGELTGFTFSQGAPGGPKRGALLAAEKAARGRVFERFATAR